jgi:hypothetical protein
LEKTNSTNVREDGSLGMMATKPYLKDALQKQAR